MDKQDQPSKKTTLILMIAAIVLGVLGIAKYMIDANHQSNHDTTNQSIGTPTLLMHGYGGSVKSEQYFAHRFEKEGITKKPIIADVTSNGHVTLKGKIPKNEKHPVVLINLRDNENGDYKQNALLIKNVLNALQQKYQFDQFNMVTHSMSNLSFSYYMLQYSNNPDLPTLHKEVNIAGTFNGIIGINDEPGKVELNEDGKPNRMTDEYVDLLNLRKNKTYPKVEVLNIYGNVEDGTNSDERVTNASSKSLRYLLEGNTKSYKEVMIKGKGDQHSQLHENPKVAQQLIDFLWK
ncbi:alpha/beta hydrolase [Staphylococcus carnosus]|uniref:alpha/beta hydrolase n=2 Tax=Staphylococcus carnosus TaxID=1281 RepID=UPI0020A2ACAF|nr:alpha/beta hydrolase [Staphylococcus carnosus]UTB80160.1 alpha/beta hydrolase [Staphylococcus carnosus]UTB84927.1 alpha/beta hydrolase [Staphylococcus carnosus]